MVNGALKHTQVQPFSKALVSVTKELDLDVTLYLETVLFWER